ncbi:MAG: hypothetical protein ACI4FZ_01200 [Lachnospiraceae bacterium]
MAKAYILLVRTNSIFSILIHKLTKAQYTHASLGLQADLKEMFSFARIYGAIPLPAGFSCEGIDHGMLKRSPKAPCALYEITITDRTYDNLLLELEWMQKNKRQYHYSFYGTALCYLGRAGKDGNGFFCSHFVAHILHKAGAIHLMKPASLYHPNDFTRQPEFTCVYQGTLGGLNQLLKGSTKTNAADITL